MESAASISYLLQHTAIMMLRQSEQALQEQLGIGMSQLRILKLLLDEPNVQQRKLADCLGQTEASISRQIKLMSEKGYLSVTTNPKSRREHSIVPTVKGVKITEAAKDILEAYSQPLAELLGDSRLKQLHEVLLAVHDHVCAADKSFACNHSLKA